MGATITAIEDDKRWLTLVQLALEEAGVDKSVVLNFVPFDFDYPVDFSSSDYLKQLGNEFWDVVIIDGQDKTFRERIACFRQAEKFAHPDSIILVDDFWRYEELLDSNSAKNVKVFESVGPCRIGVTSTAMFFY